MHLQTITRCFLVLTLIAGFGALAMARPMSARVCGSAVKVPERYKLHLSRYVRRLGIRNVRATVGVLFHVHRTGRLPTCYLRKNQARNFGWWRGRNLWRVRPGTAIGGDRFRNREGRLPGGRRYVEADLDYAGGRRNARRLVFDRRTRGAWAIWVTMNHYRTFYRVPRLAALASTKGRTNNPPARQPYVEPHRY